MPAHILMYSHDTYGLGHIRRTMTIAGHLRRNGEANVLILTGSPIAGRFPFPEQVDFVRIPGMIKKTNDEYLPLAIRINPEEALGIRKSIIMATAQTFRPDLFIVDKEPLGLKREVLPTLEWLRKELPQTRTILGLRDIMDDAATVRQDWAEKEIYDVLERLYDEIWVYGNRELYDPVAEYAIPEAVSSKMHFTGYLPRKVTGREKARKVRADHGLGQGDKLVVVTTGGGGDGFAVMDNFLTMLEQAAGRQHFKSFLISGPFMPKAERRELAVRARQVGARFCGFYARMEEILAAADLVVSMGGYNTICEILSQNTPALIIPREKPRREQLIRAQALQRRRLVDFLPWDDLGPRVLQRKIMRLLENPLEYRTAMAEFPLTGLEKMHDRLESFKGPWMR